MKKIIFAIVAILFTANLFAAVYEDFEYEINQNKEITIVKFLNKKQQEVIIPSNINGNPVATIGEGAFAGCSKLTSITIPNSVTTIGNEAFYYCESLTSITIPNSVTTIGERAFAGCSALTSILVANTNENFAVLNYCLYNKKEKSLLYCFSKDSHIIIPNGIHTIGYCAFEDCSSLTSITIPDSVTTIGNYAFFRCSSLTSITLPNSVTTIGERAFEECSSLTSITLPNSITTIGNYAFDGCSSLTSITLPNSVTTIGERVFANCDSLTVQCYSGSCAFKYCQENDIKYFDLTIPDWLR